MTSDKLTPKQALFCKEYLIDMNATQAAIRSGYSQRTAQQMGSENLSKPVIQENLSKLVKLRMDELDLTIEGVLQDIIDTRKSATDDDKHSDRLKANEMLGKYLKMWTDKVEVSGEINMVRIDKDDENL